MADELDPALEDRLRDALSADADAVPFTLRADTIRRIGFERRRTRRTQRLTILGAAAAAIIAIAGLAASFTIRSPSIVATSPTPGASTASGPSAALSPSPSQSLPADCVALNFPDQARAFLVSTAGRPGTDVTGGNIAVRVADGSWPIDDAATLGLSADAKLGGRISFDTASHCAVAWDVSVASTASVRSALATGVEPSAPAFLGTIDSTAHTLGIAGLPSGDLIVRVKVRWLANVPAPVVDTYLLHLQVVAALPSGLPETSHPKPTVPCRAVDPAATMPPALSLWAGDQRLGPGTYYRTTWGAESSIGTASTPSAVLDVTTGSGLEIRVDGDACATGWNIGYGPVPASGQGFTLGSWVAALENRDPAIGQENRISLADVPQGDWLISAQAWFANGSGVALFRIHVASRPPDQTSISFDVDNQSSISVVVQAAGDAGGAMAGFGPGQRGTIAIPLLNPGNGIGVEVTPGGCTVLATGDFPASDPFTLTIMDGPKPGTLTLTPRKGASSSPIPLPSSSLVGCGGSLVRPGLGSRG